MVSKYKYKVIKCQQNKKTWHKINYEMIEEQFQQDKTEFVLPKYCFNIMFYLVSNRCLYIW